MLRCINFIIFDVIRVSQGRAEPPLSELVWIRGKLSECRIPELDWGVSYHRCSRHIPFTLDNSTEEVSQRQRPSSLGESPCTSVSVSRGHSYRLAAPQPACEAHTMIGASSASAGSLSLVLVVCLAVALGPSTVSANPTPAWTLVNVSGNTYSACHCCWGRRGHGLRRMGGAADLAGKSLLKVAQAGSAGEGCMHPSLPRRVPLHDHDRNYRRPERHRVWRCGMVAQQGARPGAPAVAR